MSDPLQASLQKFIDRMPFTKPFGIKVVEARRGFVSVGLPADQKLMSHLGTYQAGSLFTLAEVTGGLAVGTFVDLSKNLLLARGGKIDFREAVGESLLSEASLDEEAIAKAASDLKDHRKADLSVRVFLRTQGGKVVAESEFKYYVRLGIPPVGTISKGAASRDGTPLERDTRAS